MNVIETKLPGVVEPSSSYVMETTPFLYQGQQYLLEGYRNDNIGSNYEISINDTVQLISTLMGAYIEIETDQVRIRPEKSEVERLWADNTKAKRLLNWEPLYGGKDGLKRGLRETITWFSDRENLKAYKADSYNI